MITDRNKLNFVTIQWLWFLCLILVAFSSSNSWIHYAKATQPQQQQQHQPLQQQLKSTLQLQHEVESNGPLQQQQQKQQDVTVRNFSPRMDYNNNEWRPVGRGDPLKNDPTFDYSPPTLDRVRYWADSDKEKEKTEEPSAALIDAKLKKANPGKNEILLLGVTGDRLRGGAPVQQQHAPNMAKNAKAETPLLQPKYTSIRRSYYAHQLPTHLMPPPMQPMATATQQHQLQSSQMQQQQQQASQQHQVQAMHMVKPLHTEYRHNMPGHSYMTSSPMSSMGSHSKTYYKTTATQPWMHTSSSPSMSTSSSYSPMMSGNSHRYSHSHGHDSHHQESVNYISYQSRPSLTSTPSIMLGMNVGSGHHEIYSPNSIRGSPSGHKSSSSSSRKPWIHDLLQKEFIKPIKHTHSPNLYNVETIKSSHVEPQNFEPIMQQKGISTTYAPVTFVTPTMPSTTTSTTQTVYITSTSQKQTTSTSQYPMYSSTPPTHTTHAPRTTTTLSPTRLLIPNTSNLAYRPTVAPAKMTTDSLFSHYNQPEKPLRGPMYLIIEGHSKVKTYGKDELDPHKPKIVPIIPKREPVVRMADPNERRGTPETFQVKHLHTKTTKPMETSMAPNQTTTIKPTTPKPTTSKPSTATKKPPAQIKTTPKTTTTVKSKTTVKPLTTVKSALKTTVITTNASTTVKPKTAKLAPKLSVATTIAFKPILEKTTIKNEKPSSTDLKMSAKISNPNALDTPIKPSQQSSEIESPTGMQGLLSFLGSSLDSIFKGDSIVDGAPKTEQQMEIKETTTKLKPVPIKTDTPQQQIEARVSTKLEPINAKDYEDYEDDNYFRMTTEYLPRETRQVFDYDQLPESRINPKGEDNFGAFLDQMDDEDDLSAFNLDDEYEEDEGESEGQLLTQSTADSSNKQHNLIKPMDSLVNTSTEDDDFDDLSSLVDDDLLDIEEEDLTDLARKQQRQKHEAKKA